MNVLGPKQKQVVLVLRAWPAEAAVALEGLEMPRLRPVEPEEPVVLGPCSLVVGVREVHNKRIELAL